MGPDWTHINSVSYNAQLDQIMLSVHSFSEVWIIDHGTTIEEAASHMGGRSGKGGDLLYRWGNPRAYRSGTRADQRLFAQHHAHWIASDLPGGGHMLVFNNGHQRPDGAYSSVDEVVLPVTAEGLYVRENGLPFGPAEAVWSYTAANKAEFFSMLISGAHRLPNGNTYVCSGTRAYGLGINGLYLNLKGRERDGVVEPGEAREALLEELVIRLQAVRDYDGKQVIRRVYRADEVYTGSATALAPDLIIGYAAGYRASWATCLGDLTQDVLSDNESAWSADHCADAREVPGVLFCNEVFRGRNPALIDIAPSILATFGLPKPPQMTGQILLAS